jgi:hypothetical protein
MKIADATPVTFALEVVGDRPPARVLISVASNAVELLGAIETSVRDVATPEVAWTWGREWLDFASVTLEAMPNGVSKPDLQRVVRETRAGFESTQLAAREGRAAELPPSYGEGARAALARIVRCLDEDTVDQLIVHVDDDVPLVLETIRAGDKQGSIVRRRLPEFSEVEGYLVMVSRTGRLRAAIRDYSTGRMVRCTLPDRLLDDVLSLFGERVVARGLVRYGTDGPPIAITEVTSLSERRESRALAEFIGAAPNLIGCDEPAEFIAKLRGHGWS